MLNADPCNRPWCAVCFYHHDGAHVFDYVGRGYCHRHDEFHAIDSYIKSDTMEKLALAFKGLFTVERSTK